MFIKLIARSIFARLAGYGCLGLGFWLLYRGFSVENTAAGIGLGIGGACSILVGAYLIAAVAKARSNPAHTTPGAPSRPMPEEAIPIDPVHGSNQGG